MTISQLKREVFRKKFLDCYDNYLNISSNYKIAIGIYYKGKYFQFGNGTFDNYKYDIGSISKTMTAHLIMFLVSKNLISLNDNVSKYIKLKSGNYPSIYELLTHTAGYSHLTPVEFTIPRLLKHGYTRKNIYFGFGNKDVIKCLERRNNHKRRNSYGYSDFAYAVLAIIAENATGIKFFELFNKFIKEELELKNTSVISDCKDRNPISSYKNKTFNFWQWNEDNPYLASGGIVSNLSDMLSYVGLEIECLKPYIFDVDKVCKESFDSKSNIGMCIGWHTYKKSNQLWHVGGVGTFRSSIIFNRVKKIGVVVLGNAKGIKKANVHYISKMIYSEIKINKIKL